jgi:protein-arginine kinase activator protein McsA
MREFGTNEYGDKNGFEIKCKRCGNNNARIVPTSFIEDGKTKKIVLELRCTCGNKYGATIYG